METLLKNRRSYRKRYPDQFHKATDEGGNEGAGDDHEEEIEDGTEDEPGTKGEGCFFPPLESHSVQRYSNFTDHDNNSQQA